MRFRAGDLEFNASVVESGDSPSSQTGDALRWLTIQFRAQKTAVHEQALEQAQQRQSGGLFSIDEPPQPELEWRVRESSHSFIGTQPWGINHHVWRIEQVQRLVCQRLLIASSVALEPYEYVEEASDTGGVRLAARSPISDSALEALSRIAGPVEVVRVGVSDTPRRMDVRYLWASKAGGGAMVVVQCEDVAEPRLTRHGARAGFDEPDATSTLLELLRTKGIVSDADIEHVRSQRHAARQVASVDGWDL